jgi:hypothetical protein
LLRTAKELDIALADNLEGELEQISAIKDEERLRANLAEAAYQAHLDNLRHRDCCQIDEGLDMSVIDNS